jgi:hypothetical protein
MMRSVRTTVTLDPDARDLLERAMRERGLSFKQALNYAVRRGLGAPTGPADSYTTPRQMGPARVDLVKAVGLADQFEDEALARRVSEGR